MEILVATFAMISYLFSGHPASAFPDVNNSVPYELIHEYQTKQECEIAIADTNDICMTEPDLYLGTRHYSRVADRGEVYKNNVCNRITGCAVDQDARSDEEYCPTCSTSKWYLMND